MLIEYKAPCDYPANRGRPKIAKGTTLYAIKHKGLHFIWSYIDKAYAQKMDEKMADGPKTAFDHECNWRTSLNGLSPSGRTTDDSKD